MAQDSATTDPSTPIPRYRCLMPGLASPIAARVSVALATAAILSAAISGTAGASIVPAPITDGSDAQAPTSASIQLDLVTSGLERPIFITSARDGTGRMFIIEQGGKVLVLKNGSVLATPLLDLTASVAKGGEQGLLGLAFHPSFETNRRFYVNYTDTRGDTVIREYKTSTGNPDVVQAGSARTILRIDQPYNNHNGGMLAFGPKGFLYVGMGDGGGADDPEKRAQNVSSLLGKVLRINVNGTSSTRSYLIPSSNPYVGKTGRDEIWQRGLRNPWRFSFDRKNGNLWIGDVGQAAYEEVDRAINNDSGPGRGLNWGWRVMEGHHCHIPSSGCSTTGKRLPVAEYTHASNGRCAITGGYVYRGSAIADLYGYYVFGDFCSGEIFAIWGNASWPASRITLADDTGGRMISSFGESDTGELFVVDLGGSIYAVAPS
jgi:glucose/arabinose dehydrogenase